jgi:hypothetical protein
MDGVPGPLSGQFSNWPFEGVFGVGDCGIETRQNVANCNVFRTYATAVGKPGQFRNLLRWQKAGLLTEARFLAPKRGWKRCILLNQPGWFDDGG